MPTDVDGADFVAWQTHFPAASGATLADADDVDFVVWQTSFPFAPSPAAPVPEPSAIQLLAAAVVFAIGTQKYARASGN